MSTKWALITLEEYPYGYCGIGQRFHAAVFGGRIMPPPTNLLKLRKRTQRVSWIAARKQGNLFAPMTNECSCNQDLFELWLEKCLLPQLQPGNAKERDPIVKALEGDRYYRYYAPLVRFFCTGCRPSARRSRCSRSTFLVTWDLSAKLKEFLN